MTLNVPLEWIITNDSTPQHLFHIHTNSHQLVEQGSIIYGQYVPLLTYNPPVWGDTIALPVVTQASSQGQQGCWNIAAGPIVNNDAAQQQCSAACAAQKMTWYGNWVTTIQAGCRSANVARRTAASATSESVSCPSTSAANSCSTATSLATKTAA